MYTKHASVLVETFPLAGRRVLRRPSRFPPAEMGVVASFDPFIPQILLSPSAAAYSPSSSRSARSQLSSAELAGSKW